MPGQINTKVEYNIFGLKIAIENIFIVYNNVPYNIKQYFLSFKSSVITNNIFKFQQNN